MLYNGKVVNKENIFEMITESIENNWKKLDLFPQSELIFEKMVTGYDGLDEDLDYIIEELKIDNAKMINLQTIEIIIMDGEWNFGKWEDYKLIDYWNGSSWEQVDKDFLENVARFKDIREVHEQGEEIKVIYCNDKEVYYKNIHGSWGFPYTIE